MEYILISAVAFAISVLALFSGFGVGTVLMPFFAFFFPLPIAIASTALVHLLNNIFKSFLVGKFADWHTVLRFGIPAVVMAILGAVLLTVFADRKTLFTYYIGAFKFDITVLGLIVGITVMLSSLFELIPKLRELSIPKKYVPIGGAMSGFFGGLSGNQGILRSAFLIKTGLSKDQFIGTSAICSMIVDVSRLFVYAIALFFGELGQMQLAKWLIIIATLAALFGSYIGTKLMHKVSFKIVQIFVGVMLLVLGFAIAIGSA